MRVFRAAIIELSNALRTRRAIVYVVLYLAVSLLGMNGAVYGLSKMEDELSKVLQVERVEGKSGIVSAALWKSKPFQRFARGIAGDSLIYDDICGKHPAELIYAWIVFMAVPLLAVFVSDRRISDDVKSGAAKYMLLRITRFEFTVSKYIGQALLVLCGLLVGALGAWCVAAFRLSGADIPALLPAMVIWSLKAWILSLAWIGIALGISHFFKSGAKAEAIAVLMLIVFSVMPSIIVYFADGDISGKFRFLQLLFPSAASDNLWRASFLPVAVSAGWLVMLGLFYLSIGYVFFARRDVR